MTNKRKKNGNYVRWSLGPFIWLWWSFHNVFICQHIKLYTLNTDNFIGQLHLNRAGENPPAYLFLHPTISYPLFPPKAPNFFLLVLSFNIGTQNRLTDPFSLLKHKGQIKLWSFPRTFACWHKKFTSQRNYTLTWKSQELRVRRENISER